MKPEQFLGFNTERNGENINPQESTHQEKSIRDKVIFPHVEAIQKELKKFADQPESGIEIDSGVTEIVREILYTFLEQRIKDTHIYTSEKLKVSFPWARTNIAELAKELYAKYKNKFPSDEISPQPESNLSRRKKEFIFGTFISPQGGNQFVFLEEVMHQVMKELPAAIRNLKDGKEPDKYEIYTVGSPTNKLGTMSPDFLESLKNNNAFDQFGTLYAEFIESEIPKDVTQEEKLNIYLYGISMGGAFASRTAHHMIDNGSATQSQDISEKQHLPLLQIRIDNAPGSSNLSAKRRKLQLKPGFIIESAYTMVTNPYIRKVMLSDEDFIGKANAVLADQGINENMTDKQKDLKVKAINTVVKNLENGVPFPKDIRVTEVMGIYDPLMYSNSLRKDIKRQKKIKKPSLGKNLITTPQTNNNRRIHAINSTHTMPFLRENELRRIYKAAKSLESLK